MSTDDFFDEKRPWSKIKDQILGSYMSAYFAKVSRLRRPILIIDAFAGPGVFEDGAPGSPLIICSAAEKYARGRYRAIFMNKEKEHHEHLQSILNSLGYSATPMLGDSASLLREIQPLLEEDYSVFLYLDPFGLKGCNFDTVKPFLERRRNLSTEVLINLSSPILHRLAAREKYREDPQNSTIASYHNTLTETLGGDYWKSALLVEDLETKERERRVVEGYLSLLSSTDYLTYSGYCPVQPSRDGGTKYYMIFASPHPDAMVLFNDNMLTAFEKFMHQQEDIGPLFSDIPWNEWRDTSGLQSIVLKYAKRYQNYSRKKLWYEILRDHFMKFTSREYREAVKKLKESDKIEVTNTRGTGIGRLNDDALIRLRSVSDHE